MEVLSPTELLQLHPPARTASRCARWRARSSPRATSSTSCAEVTTASRRPTVFEWASSRSRRVGSLAAFLGVPGQPTFHLGQTLAQHPPSLDDSRRSNLPLAAAGAGPGDPLVDAPALLARAGDPFCGEDAGLLQSGQRSSQLGSHERRRGRSAPRSRIGHDRSPPAPPREAPARPPRAGARLSPSGGRARCGRRPGPLRPQPGVRTRQRSAPRRAPRPPGRRPAPPPRPDCAPPRPEPQSPRHLPPGPATRSTRIDRPRGSRPPGRAGRGPRRSPRTIRARHSTNPPATCRAPGRGRAPLLPVSGGARGCGSVRLPVAVPRRKRERSPPTR